MSAVPADHARPGMPDDAAAIGRWLRARLRPGARLVSDSRQVRAGDVFFAYPGQHSDGRLYVTQALERGAAVIVLESDDGRTVPAGQALPQIPVRGLRDACGPIAAAFHDDAVSRLRVCAVTGTNGKTSVSHWIAQGLADVEGVSAIVGTLGAQIVGANTADAVDTGLTTPDALGLHRLLADFVSRGVRAVAMEASSIGLDQGRINGVPVEVAIFTNLSRDHLDYHPSMDDYASAKARLFNWPGLRNAVINGDDPVGVKMLGAIRGDRVVNRIVYGFSPGRHGARGDRVLLVDNASEDAEGITLSLGGDFGHATVRLAMLGRFNVSNALAVAASWIAMGVPFEEAALRLEMLEPVPGRMQRISAPGLPMVVVDYAHTPDALANTLGALRPVARVRGGALWCVFGAGGDRDPGKRPLMGFVAQRGADHLVITSDNPRSEVPFRIVSDIRAGLNREPHATELDRARAIELAIAQAQPGDVILIAGKGHETYQEIEGRRLPFSDVAVARHALSLRTPAPPEIEDSGGVDV